MAAVRKTYRGATQEGVATAILQCAQRTVARIRGTTRKAEGRRVSTAGKTYRGATQEGWQWQ